jgi:hypothetical protein
MKPLVSMRRALEDANLFGSILPGESWASWRILLIAMMGEPLTDAEREVFAQLTGREREPLQRVEEFWGCIGRRGGKTRAIAVLAAYQASLVDFADVLAPGEKASLPILSHTVDQAQKCFSYLDGIFSTVPALKKLVVGQTADTITLSTRVVIECRPASFRSIRGGTACAAVADEIAVWRSDTSSNPDSEVLSALRPCLATTGGLLACISSPYARKGELWNAVKRDFGANGDPLIMVAKAASRVMNSTLTQKFVDRQYERDPASARAEYGAEFRSDIESFLTIEAIEACIETGRLERPYLSNLRYVAFIDPSGGSGQDSMTIAVAHSERRGQLIVGVLDALREVRPPFSPDAVTEEFLDFLKQFHVTTITGDRWGSEFVQERYRKAGVKYLVSEKVKSDIYVELLPAINSRRVDLLDNARLKTQLCSLERRTARGGRDSIDHPTGNGQNCHDDIANACAGALTLALVDKKRVVITPLMLETCKKQGPYRGLGGYRSGKAKVFF